MNRVVHFEIHAADPERAAKFYREVFGWEIAEWIIPGVKLPEENRYWTVTTGPDDQPGINGGIVIRRGPPPTEGQAVSGHICTIEVASVDLSLERVQQASQRWERVLLTLLVRQPQLGGFGDTVWDATAEHRD